MTEWTQSTTPNFSPAELCCKCGQCDRSAHMQQEFMSRLQYLRDYWKKPLTITSAYRCDKHPEEKSKPRPGSHNQGRAADIYWGNWSGDDKYKFLMLAMNTGFQGIGIAKIFIHLDDGHNHAHRPAMWSY